MATKLDMQFARDVVDGAQALVNEVVRLETLQEKKDAALTLANQTLNTVLTHAPGYDWNADPLNLTRLTGETFAAIQAALK